MTIFAERPGLLPRFRAGERAALEEVYWRYVERIERLVRHGFTLAGGTAVGGARPEDVADLVHDVFVRAFGERARDGYDGLRPFGPYLATIARHAVVDWARARRRELREVELTLEIDSLPEPPEPVPRWADPATGAVVETYLANLAPELAAVHRERNVLGKTQADAAAALTVSRQALRTREARLLGGLRRALARARLSPGRREK
jgi:RNA polymerase sigma factor (sigma-70 family)